MENRGGEMFVVAVIFLGLCWATVMLRVYCRAWVIRSLGIDDHIMVLALVIFTCYLAVQIQAVHYGAGRHRVDLDPETYSRALELMYVSQILYIASTCILKMSVGFFLLRISVKPGHVWAVRILMLVTLLFGVTYLMVVAMQCLPVRVFWEISPRDPYQCLPQNVLLVLTYCGSVINGLTDWGFGILPFFIVWSLSLPLKSRIMVIAILSFAMVGCSATIVRARHIPRLLDAEDFLFATADVAIWSTVEPGIGITAASLATLRPLWELVCFRMGLRAEGPRATLWMDKLPDDKTGGLEAASGAKAADKKLSVSSGGQVEPEDKLAVKVDAASSIASEAKDKKRDSSNNYTHYISSSSTDGSSDAAVADVSNEKTPKNEDSEAKRNRYLFASSSMIGLQVVPQGAMLDTPIHPHRKSMAAKSYSAQMDDVYEDIVHQMSGAFSSVLSVPGSIGIPRDPLTLSTACKQEDDEEDARSAYSDAPRLDWKTPRISRFSLSSYWTGRSSYWGGRGRLSRADSYGASLQRRGTQRSRHTLNRENSHGSRHLRPRLMPSSTSSSRRSAASFAGPLPPAPIEPVPEMPLRFLRRTESRKDEGGGGGGGGGIGAGSKI